jgi:hypothetical protein
VEKQIDSRRRGLGRVILVLIVLLMLTAVVGGYWLWSRPTFDLVRLPMSDDYRAWPMERFWQWKVRLTEPGPDEDLQLQLHTRAEPAPNGTSAPIYDPQRKLLTPKSSEKYVTAGDYRVSPGQPSAREVTIAFQVIDYPPGRRTPGLATTQPTGNRSVLGSIDYGGATSFITNTESLPLDGTFEGWQTETDKNWTSPTLLLARFWLTQYGQRRLYELRLVRHDLKRWPVSGDRDE